MDSIAETLAALERSIAPDAAIQAFMHDPPDKALAIQGHEFRAARYLGAATVDETSRDSIKADSALGDQLAAIAERLPMPTAGKDGERAVGPCERFSCSRPGGMLRKRSVSFARRWPSHIP